MFKGSILLFEKNNSLTVLPLNVEIDAIII